MWIPELRKALFCRLLFREYEYPKYLTISHPRRPTVPHYFRRVLHIGCTQLHVWKEVY